MIITEIIQTLLREEYQKLLKLLAIMLYMIWKLLIFIGIRKVLVLIYMSIYI